MPIFSRSFDIAALSKWDAEHPTNAVRALFERCALPGREATSAQPLRLGVRGGYVNFYAKGQSVAKLSCGRAGPKLSVHKAYASGRRRNDPGETVPTERPYVSFETGILTSSEAVAKVDTWIATASTYASAEKRFVDDLVAANPGVIDLEMGLPASDTPGSPRVAPRMDIVIAQMVGGAPSIAFWEAKCANNSELRSQSEYAVDAEGVFSGPKVINQVRKYVDWMKDASHINDVKTAYQATAVLLLEFHRLFWSKSNVDAPDCAAIWRALSGASDPIVIVEPGVVIGNYWPEGSTEEIASERMGQAARSFTANGHRDKLERNGITVFEVASKGAKLPSLPVVSA